MATTDRIKFDRKALREPDEFQALTAQASAWIRANQTLVYAVLGGLGAIVVVGLGLSWYRGRQDAAAAVRFESAYAQFGAGKYPDAAEAFAGLGRDYGSTPFGRLASLYRGHALSRQGDAAGAAVAYGEYLAASPRAEYLRQEALLGLARAQEATGASAEARESFARAADLQGPFRTEARLGLARMAEAAGDVKGARDIYVALLAEAQPGTPLRGLLEAKLPADLIAAGAADAK